MHEPIIRKISRTFAASVIIDGPATPRAIAHLISMAAPACSETRDGFRDEVIYGEQFYPAQADLGTLVEDAGVPRIASFAPIQMRLRQTKYAFLQVKGPKRVWRNVFDGMHNAERGRLRSADTVTCLVDKGIVASAHWPSDTRGGAVGVDVAALREFTCHFSAALYLRALAWMPGGWIRIYDHWKHRREATAWTSLRIPLADVCDALGTVGFTQPSRITQKVLEPAEADLRLAGIEMRHHWIPVPGYERKHSHLALSFRKISQMEQGVAA